ncbi:hypothetical protein AU375_02207 [Methylobacterium radiotolerans]|nr:hypothetical protein AU375_02207 [Methylobacterium radiotolerans]
MEQTKHPKAEALDQIDAVAREAREPTTRIRTGNLVLLAADERVSAQGRNQNPSPVERWPDLLERVQGAARYIRDVEDRAQKQESHVQQLLRQVRADMDAARAQVLAAERETHEVHAQAIKLIQAAEDRAAAAEERAAAAEQMLQRIAETIDAEFVMQPGGQAAGQAAGQAGSTQDARTRASATRAAS